MDINQLLTLSHKHPIIVYDGQCRFCHFWVTFVINRDHRSKFRFLYQQSTLGSQLLENSQYFFSSKPDSVLLMYNNKIYSYSDAAIKILLLLSPYWFWVRLFYLIPLFIRDGLYKYIAKNRYKWFGKSDDCILPNANHRDKFIEV